MMQDTAPTLPSALATQSGRTSREELVLTIAFHPDLARIGQSAKVPRQSGLAPWVLGRMSPDFAGASAPQAALDDPHVSRQALALQFSGRQLMLKRFAGSSRCRLDGEELVEERIVSGERLRAGVALMLSHSVVLLLRLVATLPGQNDGSLEASQIIGSSRAMLALRRQIANAAATDLDVLIRGETGSGKELVAAAIHAASARAQHPMISVNMSAIPAELAPAALFGSARGAFTGADRASPGYFRQARGGTLFLDEIGDAPDSVQPQLLRALQQREVQAVGGSIERVDVRIVSATDAELESPESGFKAALLHRLGALEIEVPPLRDRPEDIGELLRHFLRATAVQLHRDKVLPHADMAAKDIAVWSNIFYHFCRYAWPGNVRELANLAQRLLVQCDSRPQFCPSVAAVVRPADASRHYPRQDARRRMRDIPDSEFDAAMLRHAYEIKGVAEELAVSRSAVYRRIESSPDYRLATEISRDELSQLLQQEQHTLESAAKLLKVPLRSLRQRARAWSL